MARAPSARRPALAPEAPRSDPAKRFLSIDVAKKKPSTSDRGVAPRCEAQWDALDRSRPSPCRVTVLPARRAHRLDLGGLRYRNRGRVRRRSLQLCGEGRAVCLPAMGQGCCLAVPLVSLPPLAVASFGGATMTGQWLRWRSRRARCDDTHQRNAGHPQTRHSGRLVAPRWRVFPSVGGRRALTTKFVTSRPVKSDDRQHPWCAPSRTHIKA